VEAPPSAPHLLPWDVDRTLVDIGGISQEVYAEAFTAVTGRRLERMPDMAGRTDRELVLAVLQRHDVVGAESHLDAS
jgi:phosphoglycolate phosphatase